LTCFFFRVPDRFDFFLSGFCPVLVMMRSMFLATSSSWSAYRSA